ncbi:MAG: dihydrofolate reductase [bacterium]|nr:dihydrofolate reductase [bacterium]
MKLSIIAACSQGRVIGKDGQLPWRLPADLKRFKKITSGHAVVMGRKTAESIVGLLGGPLPGRVNYVLTRSSDFNPLSALSGGGGAGFHKVKSLHEVVASIEMTGETELFFIGGAQVFSAVLHLVDKLYLTCIDEGFEGDAYFPEIVWEEWNWVEQEMHQPSKGNPYTYHFAVLERKK